MPFQGGGQSCCPPLAMTAAALNTHPASHHPGLSSPQSRFRPTSVVFDSILIFHKPLLVACPNQIITQLLHRCGCLTRLYGLGVVCDEEGLLGLDDHDAFFSLYSFKGEKSKLLPNRSNVMNSEDAYSKRSRGGVGISFFTRESGLGLLMAIERVRVPSSRINSFRRLL